MDLTKFPNEILIKIFEYCKVLRLTQVCKRFNEVISDSPVLMKKLHLLITEKIKYSNLESQRKYQNILFKFNYKINHHALSIVKECGCSIKSLELMRCIVHENDFINILHSLPNLEVISIYTTFIKNDFNIDMAIPEMRKLKKFNFRNSSARFLQIFRKSPILKSINVVFPYNQPEALNEFLEAKPDIQEIENFMAAEIDDKVFAYILGMKNLKKLSMELDKIKMNAIRNLNIANTSIISLSLYENSTNPDDLNIILRFFKGLKTLEFEMNSTLDPTNIQQINSMNINSLNFIACTGYFLTHLHLPSLKSLSINDASDITEDEWSQLIHQNPNIEILKIKDESICNNKFIIIIQDFRKLRHLEIFFDPQRLTPNILNFIADNHFSSNIKILKISKRNPPLTSNDMFFQLNDEQKKKLNLRHGFQLFLN